MKHELADLNVATVEVSAVTPMKGSLQNSINIAIPNRMNAAQIIKAIELLPEDERCKVLEFARHQPHAETLAAMREPIDDLPRFETEEALFEELHN